MYCIQGSSQAVEEPNCPFNKGKANPFDKGWLPLLTRGNTFWQGFLLLLLLTWLSAFAPFDKAFYFAPFDKAFYFCSFWQGFLLPFAAASYTAGFVSHLQHWQKPENTNKLMKWNDQIWWNQWIKSENIFVFPKNKNWWNLMKSDENWWNLMKTHFHQISSVFISFFFGAKKQKSSWFTQTNL